MHMVILRVDGLISADDVHEIDVQAQLRVERAEVARLRRAIEDAAGNVLIGDPAQAARETSAVLRAVLHRSP